MRIQQRVDDAVRQLRPTCAPDTINTTLHGLFKDVVHRSGYEWGPLTAPALYEGAIRQAFYTDGQQVLDPQTRETVILPLLAAQGAELNLALHVFIALVSHLTADQVLSIMLLTGVYSGVNVFTNSLRVVMKTFDAILKAVDAGFTTPIEVIGVISKEFPDAANEAARDRLGKIAGPLPPLP